ncbi:MAG: DUF3500 domain-containing protein [Candidatus Latescibacteria bacterium]|nr:DUF3500 domain-containing protein [Candidatus Latescibacterota bacterium]
MDLKQIYREAESAKRMAEAAQAFLAALDAGQRAKTCLDFADETLRQDWYYIPCDRVGLPLKEMDPRQRQLALQLVATGLSPSGYQKTQTIMALEPILHQLEGTARRFPRDPELYYVSVFGSPGGEAPWSWRFEGHHISLNYTLVAGSMVGPTPTFFGANPAQVRHGDQTGLRALKEEEDLGRQLIRELDASQRQVALISTEAPADILTRNVPQVGEEIKPEGLAGAGMNAGQRQVLQALIEVYIHRLPEELARVEWGKLVRADLNAVRFAWAGGIERGQPHYYRVQGPAFLAEYDNTQNDANHIHAVWRDLENDFGVDLLRRHYQQAH